MLSATGRAHAAPFLLRRQSPTEEEIALRGPAPRAKPVGDPTPPLGLFWCTCIGHGGGPDHRVGEWGAAIKFAHSPAFSPFHLLPS